MERPNRISSFWENRLLPWLRKVRCAWSEDYHFVEHWELDEGGAAAGHGTCIYCGREVSMSILMGRNLGGRDGLEDFADRRSRSTCPKCGSADYTLITREDAYSMPEYVEVEKQCNRCGHTWGWMGFSPY